MAIFNPNMNIVAGVTMSVQCNQCGVQYPIGGGHTCPGKIQHLYVSKDELPLCGATGSLWEPKTEQEAESAGVCLKCHRKARRKWEGKGVRRAVEWFPFPHEVEDKLLDIAKQIEEGSIG